MWKRNREYFIFAGLWALGILCWYSGLFVLRTGSRSPSLPLSGLLEHLIAGVALFVTGCVAFIVAQVFIFRSMFLIFKRRREQKQRQNAKGIEETLLFSQDGVWPPAPSRVPVAGSPIYEEIRDDDPQEGDIPRSKKLPAIFFVGLWIVAIGCFYIAIPLLSTAHRGTEEIVVGGVHLVIGIGVLIMALVLSFQNILLAAKTRRAQKQSREAKEIEETSLPTASGARSSSSPRDTDSQRSDS